MKTLTRMAALATAAAVAASPLAAAAQPYSYGSQEYQRGYNPNGYDRSVSSREARAYRDNYDARCRHERRSSGNKGTVAGALVGGASGALIGGDVLGGLVGAGVGAVAGHAIAKNRDRC